MRFSIARGVCQWFDWGSSSPSNVILQVRYALLCTALLSIFLLLFLLLAPIIHHCIKSIFILYGPDS